MALTATMYRFELNVSDVDRGVYESLELRVAQHPSESDAYLVTRVLAMALEYREGLSFGRGVSSPDEAPLSAPHQAGRAVGQTALWVEIGHPSGDRLHKVAKLADEVVVYTHKSPEPILAELASGQIYRGDEVVVVALAPEFVDELAGLLTRNARWDVLRTEGVLYVTAGEQTVQTMPEVYGRTQR